MAGRARLSLWVDFWAFSSSIGGLWTDATKPLFTLDFWVPDP